MMMSLLHRVALLGFAITLLSASAWADYSASSYLPNITGQASAPTAIPITHSDMHPVKNPDGSYGPAQADTFTYTITGKDLDTYKDIMGGTTTTFFDPTLSCRKGYEQYPVISGPSFRGFAGDGTATWDVVGRGVLVSPGVPAGASPAQVFVNSYVIYNDAAAGGVPRDVLLNDPEITVQQTLNKAAY